MIDLNLTDRRAVVTGASLGIGAATVRLLADHGAAVSFCARSEDAVAALDGYEPPSGSGSVAGHVADMADRASIDAFFEAALAGGTLDILVNNVGASPSRNFLYMSDDDWEEPVPAQPDLGRPQHPALPAGNAQAEVGPCRDDRQAARRSTRAPP